MDEKKIPLLEFAIRELTCSSTNKNWQKDGAYDDNNHDMIYKSIQVKGLRVLWKKQESLMEPTDALLKLSLNSGNVNLRNEPQVMISMILLKCNLKMTFMQGLEMVKIITKWNENLIYLQNIDTMHFTYGKEWKLISTDPSSEETSSILTRKWKKAYHHVLSAIRLNVHWRSWKTIVKLATCQQDYLDALKSQDQGR